MNTQPASLRRERILSIGLIVIGLILVLGYGLRTVGSYIRIQQRKLEPGVADVETIRDWMTIPYIATVYGMPEEYLFEQLRIPPEGYRTKSLNQMFVGKEAAIRQVVKDIIRRYRAEHPASTGAEHDWYRGELVNDFMNDFSCFLLGGVAFWAGIYMLQRRRRQRQPVIS